MCVKCHKYNYNAKWEGKSSEKVRHRFQWCGFTLTTKYLNCFRATSVIYLRFNLAVLCRIVSLQSFPRSAPIWHIKDWEHQEKWDVASDSGWFSVFHLYFTSVRLLDLKLLRPFTSRDRWKFLFWTCSHHVEVWTWERHPSWTLAVFSMNRNKYIGFEAFYWKKSKHFTYLHDYQQANTVFHSYIVD